MNLFEALAESAQNEKFMRLRDEFAMAAMQSIIMLEGLNHKPESCDTDLAKAYMYANSAIKAREVKP